MLGEPERFGLQDRRAGVARRFTLEGRATRDHFVKHDAQTPDVRARVEFQTSDLFGRHVCCGSHHDAGLGLDHGPGGGILINLVCAPTLSQLGKSKVEHLHNAVSAYHDVFRFDIAMNDSSRMRAGER